MRHSRRAYMRWRPHECRGRGRGLHGRLCVYSQLHPADGPVAGRAASPARQRSRRAGRSDAARRRNRRVVARSPLSRGQAHPGPEGASPLRIPVVRRGTNVSGRRGTTSGLRVRNAANMRVRQPETSWSAWSRRVGGEDGRLFWPYRCGPDVLRERLDPDALRRDRDEDVGIRPFGYGTALIVTIGLWLTLAPAIAAIVRTEWKQTSVVWWRHG